MPLANSVPDYFVTAIDLRNIATLYEKNASPITADHCEVRARRLRIRRHGR